MKVLIINFEYPPLGGGGGVATKQIAEELAKRHEVHVLTSAAPTVGDFDQTHVHLHRVQVWARKDLSTASLLSLISFVPAATIKGISLCREISFDVLNAQFVLPSGIPASILSKLFKLPLVVSLIGGDIYDPTKGISPHNHFLLRWLVRQICRRATICTAISEDTKRRATELHGVKEQIKVVPLGLVPCEVPPATRSELQLPAGLIGVSIGRLIPRKGYDYLLRAWAKLPGGYLVIMGGGPLKQYLFDLAGKLDIRERILFLGHLPETKKLQVLRASDFYISAAQHEGFGIVLLEAMDAGLPIVTTNNGGQSDFLKVDRNALFVPINDTAALVRQTNHLLDNEELRNRMGENNRRDVKAFYIEQTAGAFENILLTAAGNQRIRYEGSN